MIYRSLGAFTPPLGRSRAAMFALAILLALAAFLLSAHPALASTTGVPSSGDLSSVFSTAGASSYFSWNTILGFLMYVLAPIGAIVALIVIGWNLKDNHNPGTIIGSVLAAAFVVGLVFVAVSIPSQVHAGTNGALITTSLLS